MDNKKKVLGKGLEQLFANNLIDDGGNEKVSLIDAIESIDGEISEVLLSEIRPNPYQPRKTFSEEALKELADSIKTYGVVQPVVVKKSIKGYELIAGERRCKASKLAGLKKVPVLIKNFTDQEMMEIALLENLQREDLNPIEVAESMDKIIKSQNYTQEDFAIKIGKSRSYVTNLIGILRLPDVVKHNIANKQISMSHAKILSKLEDKNKIAELCDRVIRENMSVHTLEKILADKNSNVKDTSYNTVNYGIFETLVSDYLDEKVKISKSKIEIKFEGKNDLMRILDLMNIKVDD